MRKFEKVFKAQAGKNSLHDAYKYKNPIIIAWNFLIIYSARFCPSLWLKNYWLRLTGMKVAGSARIGLCAMFDIFFPEKITIGENALIGYNATILAHEYLIDEFRVGRTTIGRNVLVGTNSTVLAGCTIGDNSVVSAMTLVNGDVPENSFVEGVPMRISAKKEK